MKRFNVSKLKMSLEPLLPGRDPKAGIDQELDTMFERALSVREFARSRGWLFVVFKGAAGGSWRSGRQP